MSERASDKTMLRRAAQHRDRWTAYGEQNGLSWISERLSPAELRQHDPFVDLDDDVLERISPDVSMALWDEGAVLFEEGTYIDLAFFIVQGAVEVSVRADREGKVAAPIFDRERSRGVEPIPDAPTPAVVAPETTGSIDKTQVFSRRDVSASHTIAFLTTMDFDLPVGAAETLEAGEFFGEIGAMSGWPQSVTARTKGPCRLLQIRLPALRILKRRSRRLRERLDALYRERSLLSQLERTPLLESCPRNVLRDLADAVELVSCGPDEEIVREGEPAEAFFVVRSGFLRLMQRVGDGDAVVSYLSKGMSLGETELLVDGLERWEATVRSVEHAELVRIPKEAFRRLLERRPEIERRLWPMVTDRIRDMGRGRDDATLATFTEVALDRGLVQGNSILVIDLERCTRCDDCVRACAATHGGRSRFVREGNKVGSLLVARSCYHCRDPVCLVGCPTGAIHRAGTEEVVEIDEEICIGCSTCANNCPYDAIVMHDTGEVWPEDMVPVSLRGDPRLVASKCDLCHDTGHGPACVSNCPQACAYRVGSVEEFRGLLGDPD